MKKSASVLEALEAPLSKAPNNLTTAPPSHCPGSRSDNACSGANLRTWLRTDLVAMAGGIGARALVDQHVPAWLAVSSSAVMISFSVFCCLAAAQRQFQLVRNPSPDVKGMPGIILLSFSLLMSAVAVAALVVVTWAPLTPS